MAGIYFDKVIWWRITLSSSCDRFVESILHDLRSWTGMMRCQSGQMTGEDGELWGNF